MCDSQTPHLTGPWIAFERQKRSPQKWLVLTPGLAPSGYLLSGSNLFERAILMKFAKEVINTMHREMAECLCLLTVAESLHRFLP